MLTACSQHNYTYHFKNFTLTSWTIQFADFFSNMYNDTKATEKPNHSTTDNFCPNNGIASKAAKSGSEHAITDVLVAPSIRELSKKITQLNI